MGVGGFLTATFVKLLNVFFYKMDMLLNLCLWISGLVKISFFVTFSSVYSQNVECWFVKSNWSPSVISKIKCLHLCSLDIFTNKCTYFLECSVLISRLGWYWFVPADKFLCIKSIYSKNRLVAYFCWVLGYSVVNTFLMQWVYIYLYVHVRTVSVKTRALYIVTVKKLKAC